MSLRGVSAFALVLDQYLSLKRNEIENLNSINENQSSKLPNKTVKALMTYFKTLALDENSSVDSSLKRSYLAFYAQLLGMKELDELDSSANNADALIVKFIAVVSKHGDKSLVKEQGSQFLELLRSVVKKLGGSPALDAELASKTSFFGEPVKPIKGVGLDLKDIHQELGIILSKMRTNDTDLTESWSHLNLENFAFLLDQEIAEIYSGRHPLYTQKSFGSEEEYQNAVLPDIRKLEELKQGVTGAECSGKLVPSNVRSVFKEVLSICILKDLGQPTLLAPKTRSTISFISQVWCINRYALLSCLVCCLADMFEQKIVPLNTIRQGIEYVLHTRQNDVQQVDLSMWPQEDQAAVIYGLKKLCQTTIDDISSSLTLIFTPKPVKLGPYIELIDSVSMLRQQHILSTNNIKQLKQAIHRSAETEYEKLVSKIPRDSSLSVDHVVELMSEINKRASKLQRKYKVALFEKLPIAKLVSSTFFELFSADFLPLWEFCMRQCEVQRHEPAFEDMKALHHEFQVMEEINAKQQGEEVFQFDHEKLVFPYFMNWADKCGALAREWVKPAIEQDENTPIQGVYYSTSVQDLFKSFYANLSLVQALDFQPYLNAKLVTRIVQGISDTICDWALQTHDLFVASNLVKPKQEWSMFNQFQKVEPPPFSFTFETGVKLNNVSQAFQMMHNMENSLKADDISMEIQRNERMQKAKPKSQVYLFTVTILGAKDLPANLTNYSNFYVTLIDQDTRKTCGRTQVSTNLSANPQWNEPFEVTLSRPKIMKACLWRQSANGNHDFVGRAQLKLDPTNFSSQEYGMQIMSLDLDSGQGRLAVMVAIDVQMDDIRFYFGKSLRFLKRMQESMVNSCVSQFSMFIHQTLSIRNLKEHTGGESLVKSVQKGLMMLRAAPLSLGHKPQPSQGSSNSSQSADGDLSSPLDPLYDYLNSNFATLASILTPELRVDVLSRTWDVVLEAIELLILPPLDSTQTSTTQLNSLEMETVYNWLSSLRDFFYSDGAGPSLERMHSMQYQGIMSIPVYYDLTTIQLKNECDKVLKSSLHSMARNSELLIRQRTVMAHRNKSVIEHQTKAMRAAQREQPNLDDVILRILKLRGEQQFIESHLKVRQRLLQAQAMQRLLEGQKV